MLREIRNSSVHRGDILTDAELLPLLLLSDASHGNQRLPDAFGRAYGISLSNFQEVTESLYPSVIESLNIAGTVRVLKDWQQILL